MALHAQKGWERLAKDIYSILQRTYWKPFCIPLSILIKTSILLLGKKILYFALVYKFIRSLVIVTNSFIASLLIKQVARKVLFRHCSIEPYLVIANKDELKKNTLELSKY